MNPEIPKDGSPESPAPIVPEVVPPAEEKPTGPAIEVGVGVSRPKAPKKVKPPKEDAPLNVEDMTPHQLAAMFDGEAEWVDKPQLKGQIDMPGAAKVVQEETKIFDLSLTADREQYDAITNKMLDPATNVKIVHREHRAFESTGSWKVLVIVHTYKFRRLLNKGRNKYAINPDA